MADLSYLYQKGGFERQKTYQTNWSKWGSKIHDKASHIQTQKEGRVVHWACELVTSRFFCASHFARSHIDMTIYVDPATIYGIQSQENSSSPRFLYFVYN